MVTVPTQFSPNSLSYISIGTGLVRLITPSTDNLTGYFWGNGISLGGGDFSFQLIKCSLTSPTVLATGPTLTAATNGIASNTPPIPSWTGDKLWYVGSDPATGFPNGAIISCDPDTLVTIDTIVSTACPFGEFAGESQDIWQTLALNKNGTIGVAISEASYTEGDSSFTYLHIINLSTSEDFYVQIEPVAGIGDATFEYSCFDNDGHLWFYVAEASAFYEFTIDVTDGGLSIVSSYSAPTPVIQGYFPAISFNPDTNIMTAWIPEFPQSPLTSADFEKTNAYITSINTVTKAVNPSVYSTPSATMTSYQNPINLMVPQAKGWTTNNFIVVWELIDGSGPSNGAQQIGLFNRSTGVTTYYPWMATWGVPVPGVGAGTVQFGGGVVSDGAGTIVAMNLQYSSGDFPYDAWLFPFNISPPATNTHASYTRIWGNYHG